MLLRILSKLSYKVLLLTFTIESSVEIQDSYFDESLQLRCALRASIWALCFHACFGPWRQLLASIQFRGNFGLQDSKSSTASVFTIRLWRVLRPSLYASAGAISISWVAQALLAGPGTGCGQAPEQGADGQPPAAALLGQHSAFNDSYFTFVCIL